MQEKDSVQSTTKCDVLMCLHLSLSATKVHRRWISSSIHWLGSFCFHSAFFVHAPYVAMPVHGCVHVRETNCKLQNECVHCMMVFGVYDAIASDVSPPVVDGSPSRAAPREPFLPMRTAQLLGATPTCLSPWTQSINLFRADEEDETTKEAHLIDHSAVSTFFFLPSSPESLCFVGCRAYNGKTTPASDHPM